MGSRKPSSPLDPTTSLERIPSLDIVRGFALAGVFLVNFQLTISWTEAEGANSAAVWFLQNFVAGKFYRLFAFLFGVGFALQLRRLEARGAPFERIYLRRLAVLFGIGLAHGMLLWPNDILALFAQLGVLLLLIRRVSNRTLLVIGIACLFAAPTSYYVSTGFADFFDGPERGAQAAPSSSVSASPSVVDVERETERLRAEGSYREMVAWNTRYFLDWQTNWHTRLIMLREEFLMFLLGLYAARRGVFQNEEDDAPFVRRAMLASLAVGMAMYPTIGWLQERAAHPLHGHLAVTFRQIALAIQPAALSLAYGLIALRVVERFNLHERLAPIASLGRMALTNYLLVSVLVTTSFYGYGLGLHGRVSVLEGLAMAIAAYVALAAASRWWLRRYRFGPAEWVWRSLTYGSLQPMRTPR